MTVRCTGFRSSTSMRTPCPRRRCWTICSARRWSGTVAQVAGDNMLDIWLEPSKALVDHAGVTVSRVEFVKELADGTVLVNLDLSRDQVTPADQEVMVDPVI